ncbi:MAG: hypothetical protein R2748_27330 [Bryobacterales bacterium]
MNSNLRVCLIVASVMAFLLGLVVIGSGTLVYLNWDKIKTGVHTIAEHMEKRADEGREFGESSNEQGCLDESLKRADGTGAFSALAPSIFFKACLEKAPAANGFCEGTPDATQFLALATWPQGQCAEAGMPNNQGCLQVMQAKLEHCVKQRAVQNSSGQ